MQPDCRADVGQIGQIHSAASAAVGPVALAANAGILLMDEAFGVLDSQLRTDMQNQFLELHSRLRNTIIIITRDLDEALPVGDHIAI